MQFLCYVNTILQKVTYDINDVLCSNDDVGVYLFDWLLKILLFSEYMAQLSKSRDKIQKGLDKLREYCEK